MTNATGELRLPPAVRDAWERRGSTVRRRQAQFASATVDIVLGGGVAEDPAQVAMPEWPRAVVITQAGIPVPSAWPWPVVMMPTGERAKRLATLERLAEELVELGLRRGDGIIALGGGVVTDLAGFLAAIYYRGIDYVAVPTSLLAMVDAAIGGKTAVNLRAGKNLVGAFWQPRRVVVDPELLWTLPVLEWRNGLGELVKYEFLGARDLLALPLDEAIWRAVQLKVEVVEEDEREAARRALLNYGHTVGHGIEAVALAARRHLAHGAAVAIGLVVEAELARRLGRIDEARVEEHRRVVRSAGLIPRVPSWAPSEAIVAYARADKKGRGSLACVLDGPRGLELVHGVSEEQLLVAIEACR